MIASLFKSAWRAPWVLLAVGALLLTFTSRKLYKMAQINEWVPGAETVEVVIDDKASTGPVHSAQPTTFWLMWNGERKNVPRETWEATAIGDSLTLAKVDDSGNLYLKGGIYASPGNFAFDLGVLAFEIFLVCAALAMLITKFRRRRLKGQMP